MRSLFLVLFFSVTLLATPQKKEGFEWKPLMRLAIQERGRIKPLDTFARESMQFITGKLSWKGVEPTEFLFSLLFQMEDWENEAFIRVSYGPLKKALGLPMEPQYFSPKTIVENQELPKLLRTAMQKEQRREKLSELEKKATSLQNQRALIESIISGDALAVLPNPQGITQPWFPLSMLSQGQIPYSKEDVTAFAESMQGLIGAFKKNDIKTWTESVVKVEEIVRTRFGKDSYPPSSEIQRELHYNALRPFRWAWIFYLSAACFFIAFSVTNRKELNYGGLAFLFAGFAIHIYGFFIRCLIAGRPPVSNMYESVLWVTWGCVLFSIFIWAKYRKSVILTSAAIFAVVGLVLADNVPLVLDPSIHPLQPVLRSNFWLTIHVLTITLSYAAFALSLCVGNVVLGVYLFTPTKVPTIQNFTLYMYRAMQIGVILLAAGTILGGVWADYSWGRFWGWDPKEVWALIALLLYIAVLHGRFAGWLKGFGFVATTVLSFMGVLMAWYGVNFVLGVGLHSYGFGSGGLAYVVTYLSIQSAYILLAYRQYKSALRKHKLDTSIFPRG